MKMTECETCREQAASKFLSGKENVEKDVENSHMGTLMGCPGEVRSYRPKQKRREKEKEGKQKDSKMA
jgi:hypothetical protein